MKPSPVDDVRALYEESADSYNEMMDAEIELPVYNDILSRLAQRLAQIPGPVIDTSCGTGHMLARYRDQYDANRPLAGIDLSPKMVRIARSRLGDTVEIAAGDMRDRLPFNENTASAVLSFFALHHLDQEEIVPALKEWRRVLCPGGQLVVAIWEGSGAIDYGDYSDLVAFRYSEGALKKMVTDAGFHIDRCAVEPVEGFEMKAIYLEATAP